MIAKKDEKRIRRHKRIRSKVVGTADRPRLSVFKSNTTLYAQIINDEEAKTIVAVDTKKMTGKTLTDRAGEAGKAIAESAKAKKIEKIVFDRGGYRYTGVIAALAQGARDAGLDF